MLTGKRMRMYAVWSVLLAAALLLGGCSKTPVKIGFVADLTGKQAELGVQERNGVQLAVEQINANGGIDGRPVELLIRDDQGVPDVAVAVDQELIAAGVAGIIGHATSTQTMAGLAVTNPAQVVLLSPTTSTPSLTGKYEYFFRVYPSFLDSARGFAGYIRQTRGLHRLAILFDKDNAAYSQTYRDVVVAAYQENQAAIVAEASFSSSQQPDFAPLLQNLRQANPNALLLITADGDAALIAQRVRLMNWQIPLFASAWAQTETLLHNGGQAVEGMEIEQAFALDNASPEFRDFKRFYQERFGRDPSFGAAFGYEAAKAMAAALRQTKGERNGLRLALLGLQNFKGLSDTFSFAASGDVIRPFYLSAIRDGKFVIVKKLTQ